MGDLLSRYQAAVHALYDKVETTQDSNIKKAGNMVADCVDSGGAVFLSNICHGIDQDLLGRGGGPAFYKPFTYNLSVNNPGVYARNRDGVNKNQEGLARYALEASNALPGDILFISSVSGRTLSTVDLAYEAKRFGLKVIALISMEYARAVDAVHSSGAKLYDMVDLAIDNCAPAAEAMLDVDGIDAKFAAASGLASAYIMWSLTAVAVDTLIARGKPPGIFQSYNFPGGPEQGERVRKDYMERGY